MGNKAKLLEARGGIEPPNKGFADLYIAPPCDSEVVESERLPDTEPSTASTFGPPYHPSPERIRWYMRVYRTAEKNARVRGIVFNLSVSDYHLIVDRSRGCCEVSGTRFAKNDGRIARNPWAPSLDRIENQFGYTPENCRLVCVAANLAMNAWGLSVLVRLSRGVVAEHGVTGQSPEMQRVSRMQSRRNAAETRQRWEERWEKMEAQRGVSVCTVRQTPEV